MNTMKIISVLKDFSEYPGLRNCSISEFSGEDFYHKILNKSFKEAFESNESLQINLDGTGGYASSFLDEAFGNLIFDFTLKEVQKRVEIVSDQEPEWKDMIENKTFIQWESRRDKKEKPIVTVNHDAWYRLVDNKLKLEVWEQPTVL